MLDIRMEISSGTAVLAPVGRIDATTASVFESACLEVVRKGISLLIVDFGGVPYISSAGVRVLLLVGKALREHGGRLRLANVGGTVAQVFELAGFAELFPTYNSVAAAAA